MSPGKLPHYLRLHRKKVGLSQDELARLLGATSGTKVSRYERFARTPTLETALACEVILGVPVADLFGGMREQAEAKVLLRVEALLPRLVHDPATDRHRGRQALLTRFATSVESSSRPS